MDRPVFDVRRLLRFAVAWFLFAVLPLWTGYALIDYALSLEETRRRDAILADLDRDLTRLGDESDPRQVLGRMGRTIRQSVWARPPSEARLATICAAAARRWPWAVDVYVFDGHDRLLTPGQVPLRSRFLMQKLWKLLRAENPDMAEFRRQRKQFQTLFGIDFNLGNARAHRGTVLLIHPRAADGALFWDLPRHPGDCGVVVVAWRTPGRREALEVMRQRLRPGAPRILLRMGLERAEWLGPSVPRIASLGELLTRLDVRPTPTLAVAGHFWVVMATEELTLVAGRSAGSADLWLLRPPLAISAWAMALLCGLYWWRWVVRGEEPYLSIRTKLIALFAFAVFVPLVGLVFLGLRTPADREMTMRTESLNQAKEALHALDHDFTAAIEDDCHWFRRQRDDPTMRENPQQVFAQTARGRTPRRLLRFEVRSAAGKVLFNGSDPLLFEGFETIFGTFAQMCIERHLPEERRREAGNTKPLTIDPVLKMVFESPEIGFPFIIAAPDRAHILQFGPVRMIWYFDVYRQTGEPLGYVGLAESVDDSSDRYLRRNLTRPQRSTNPPGCRLMARHDDFDRWYPAQAAQVPGMMRLAERVRISQQASNESVRFRGQNWQIVGLPGGYLRGHSLFAMFPETPIQNDVGKLRRALILGGFIALAVALLTGLALADMLLTPIGELSAGIEALRARRSVIELSFADQEDELGRVARTFNAMVRDLKEMELARVVQEELLGGLQLEIPGYDNDWFSLMASDLGGDYCDAVPMVDGRHLLLIGDVTGHGVAAALIMALAKAVVFEYVQDGGPVSVLFARLNRVIFEVMKRKKMMTLFAGALAPKQGLLRFINGGHNFPIHCRATDGAVCELEQINFPLGSTARVRNPVERECRLDPGDWLLLYTDGLVEACAPTEEPFGYERVQQLLRENRHGTTAAMKKAIIAALRAHHGPGAFDDDVSLLIVHRLPA